MGNKVIRGYLSWTVLGVLLLILVAVGCSSSAGPTGDASPTADRLSGSVSQAAQPTPTDAPAATTPPTRQPGQAAPTPTPVLPTATTKPPPTTTHTPSPTATATPTTTATRTPALRRLTTGGCCTQPFWSPDSQQVLFIDKPAPDAPLGIWGVDVTQPRATPELLTERIAVYTADLTHVVEYGRGETAIERLEGPLSAEVAERWTVPAGGRPISISPGWTRIAWQVSNEDMPVERRTTEIWTANLDGSNAQKVASLPRGSLAGWVSDDVLLLTGRASLESRETTIYTYSLVDGTTVELVRAQRPRGYWLSPDRRWMAYFVTFSDEPTENGLWLVSTDGTERRQLDGSLFGDYAWRDARRLLTIPFQLESEYHELWQYDVESGEARRLTDTGVTPFKIANGDWQVSPDGFRVVFVENSDRNMWILTLVD